MATKTQILKEEYTVSLTYRKMAAAFREVGRIVDKSNQPSISTFRRHIKKHGLYWVNIDDVLYWQYLGSSDVYGDLWTPEKLKKLFGSRLISILRAVKNSVQSVTILLTTFKYST